MSLLELNQTEENTITSYRKYMEELVDIFNSKPYLYSCAEYIYEKYCSDEHNKELLDLDIKFKELIHDEKHNLFHCLKYYLKRTNEQLEGDPDEMPEISDIDVIIQVTKNPELLKNNCFQYRYERILEHNKLYYETQKNK
jgi:hypothetical protein